MDELKPTKTRCEKLLVPRFFFGYVQLASKLFKPRSERLAAEMLLETFVRYVSL